MNIGTLVGLALMVSVAFIGFNLIVSDFETNLVDTGYVNTTPFSDSYEIINQSDDIRNNFSDSIEKLQELGDSSNWWEELGDFIGAIPIVIIEIPRVIFSTLFGVIGNISTILDEIGIPPEIIIIVGLGITIWLVFKLINFWKSGKEI